MINGICDVEGHIVTEICKAYELVHPAADEVCRAVLKNLPRRFDDSDLHKSYNRIGKGALKRAYRKLEDRWLAEKSTRVPSASRGGIDMDYFEFKAMLLEIGCIGRKIDETDRYDVAEFEYTIPNRLAVGDDDIMCVHPPVLRRLPVAGGPVRRDPSRLPLRDRLVGRDGLRRHREARASRSARSSRSRT